MFKIKKLNFDDNIQKVERNCLKCNHNICYFYTQQLLASDEPESAFYKCENCGKIEKE